MAMTACGSPRLVRRFDRLCSPKKTVCKKPLHRSPGSVHFEVGPFVNEDLNPPSRALVEGINQFIVVEVVGLDTDPLIVKPFSRVNLRSLLNSMPLVKSSVIIGGSLI